ncbi:MAG: hypothetical protein H6626_14655 [Pseudobdellovibrionaceae bacterium]|nr:hypothetical protein [Bdellovibrionales bacterium]USN47404.1 MAG: hypothetical protein H6626_14655 [Pseudobdellovibrionaceae bacterium]
MGNKLKKATILFIAVLTAWPAGAEWKIDLSRRKEELARRDIASEQKIAGPMEGLFEQLVGPNEPIQEVVILNTEKGFLPNSVRLLKDRYYRFHVVNVSENVKNVSFVMDSFSEHHATYYGKIVSFYLRPKTEGVFTFECPETSAQGRVVVHPAKGEEGMGPDVRLPASRN